MKYWIKFIISFFSVIIISCAENPVEPSLTNEDPYNLRLDYICENQVKISWEKNDRENATYILSKKSGENRWDNNFFVTNSDSISIIDNIPTESSAIFSYFLTEISQDTIWGSSDTVAWISEYADPNEFTVQQIKQDSIRLSWHDNAFGEISYRISKKNGDSDWIDNYQFYYPDSINGHDSHMTIIDNNNVLGDSVFYKICVLNGSSKSNQVESSLFTSFLAPHNLRAINDEDNIRLLWTDNCINENGYNIERKQHDGTFEIVDQVASNIETCLDIEVDPSVVYYYRINAYNENISSDYSNIVIGNIDHEGIWVPFDYLTIQEAVDAIFTNEEIIILPGTYFENVQILNKYPIFKSFYSLFDNDMYIEQTIIDGQNNGSAMSFVNCDSGTPSISGFSIQNGSGEYTNSGSVGSYYFLGGGILVEHSDLSIFNMKIKDNSTELGGGIAIIQYSNCNITNTIIDNNTAHGRVNINGGGIFCSHSQLSIDNSEISNNQSHSTGGGIYLRYSDAIINNTKIFSNVTEAGGGGISIGTDSEVDLENLLIYNNFAEGSGGGISGAGENSVMRNLIIWGNHASNGGGISIGGNDVILENILLYNNSADYGAAIFLSTANVSYINITAYNNTASLGGGAIYSRNSANPIIMNSIFWDNCPQEVMLDHTSIYNNEGTITLLYSDIDGGIENISVHDQNNIFWLEGNIDNYPIFVDPNSDDFRLQLSSPCIDRGNPDPDFNDIDGSRNDMGVYGGPNSELSDL